MSRLSWFQRFYWRHLSKPVQHRALFQHVIEHPLGSILEIGIGNGDRLKQVLSLYTLKSSVKQLRYAGVDPFESGTDSGGHLRLKDVHRLLAEQQVKAHLIPGDATTALHRVAHSVLPSDLVIVDSGWNDSSSFGEALQQWLPRLVHDSSTVFARTQKSDKLEMVKVVSAMESLRHAA